MEKGFTPPWLKKRLVVNDGLFETKRILASYTVATVCESSLCPNLNECFSRMRATFMILGSACTRSCLFCAVRKEAPDVVDTGEPERISRLVERMGLGYVVVTSVTRDDLTDGGATQFVKTIEAIKAFSKDVKIEALVPDFNASRESIEAVVNSEPDVFGHNIETVERLYPIVRAPSDYKRSLSVLRLAKEINPRQVTKSAIMLGLGELDKEIVATMEDLRRAGCDMLAIGQYMRPGRQNIPVHKLISPDGFERYKRIGEGLGFRHVSSGTFIRSSYFAEESFKNMMEDDYDKCNTSAVGRRNR